MADTNFDHTSVLLEESIAGLSLKQGDYAFDCTAGGGGHSALIRDKIAPNGQCVAFIETPVQCPTMPCFGGLDMRTLFITTSAHGRSDAELQALPASGCVFATRVDTPGLPVSFFNN